MAVFALSVISHGLLLTVPLPKAEEKEAIPIAESSEQPRTEDVTVVILPEQPEESAAKEAASEDSVTRSPEPPSVDNLLQNSVISGTGFPEAAEPQPELDNTVFPPAEDTPAQEDPVLEDVPTEESPTPAYGDPVSGSEGPLRGYSSDFPHVEGSVTGCFGLSDCRRVSSAVSYRSVGRSIVSGLEDQGYSVDLRDDLEDTGRNVYELIHPDEGGTVKYLIVFSDVDGSAVYVMSNEILTLGDLQALQQSIPAG
ncbi:hypothetical protein PN498_12705 [Oscillatoria sp. CS-180]|uniref:hypothetical protein n=1 Tax=Oscillatoria sp. CS-180 TaxID=3021720 RepID=UPI00232AD89E|nr:hypothetical protein [Oscillatoria sp. CS-180]MDB9526852.1 hypothetical protein [Oscillatoria sp. CS-180]